MSNHAFPLDPITGLPWSASIREQAAEWAADRELHAVTLEVAGLGVLIDAFGYRAGQSILKQVSGLVSRQLDRRDLLGRHSGSTFLIVTQRPYEELEGLLRQIRERVFTLSIETVEGRIPEGRFGVAGMDPVAAGDDAAAAVDALIISAEVALKQVGVQRIAPPTGNGGPEALVPPAAAAEEHEEVSVRAQRDPAVVQAPPVAAPPLEPVAEPALDPTVLVDTEAAAANGETPPMEETVAVEEPGDGAEAPAVASGTEEAASDDEAEAERVTFVRCNVSDSGMAATVEVEIQFGGRTAIGKVVGRKAPERLPYLIGEATGRALTELLPHGFGVVLQDLRHVTQSDTEALWATVMLVSPDGEEKLLGIAPGRDGGNDAPARAVLNAINRRLTLILKPAS